MVSNQDVWRIADLLQHAVRLLEKAGIETPQTDAELLLAHCLSLSRTELYLRSDEFIGQSAAGNCLAMLQRRLKREPLAYITGECEFWSHNFWVSPDVLIPRPETELLIERVLAQDHGHGDREKCLDLCCGSGIIAIVLALELDIEAVGVDISKPALDICRSNCIRHGVRNRVHLVQADLSTCFAGKEQFSLITANPPYVSRTEMDAGMQPEVIEFEPSLALDGGSEGLLVIKRIAASLPNILAPGGYFFMEIGADQGDVVKKLMVESAPPGMYESVDILKDYSARDRVVQARRKSKCSG